MPKANTTEYMLVDERQIVHHIPIQQRNQPKRLRQRQQFKSQNNVADDRKTFRLSYASPSYLA
jgi:hypothetical protein